MSAFTGEASGKVAETTAASAPPKGSQISQPAAAATTTGAAAATAATLMTAEMADGFAELGVPCFGECVGCQEILASGKPPRKGRFHPAVDRVGWGAKPCGFRCTGCKGTACAGHFHHPQPIFHRDYLIASLAQRAEIDKKRADWMAATRTPIANPALAGLCARCVFVKPPG